MSIEITDKWIWDKKKYKLNLTSWEEEEAEDGDDAHVAVRRLKGQVENHKPNGSILGTVAL